MISAIIETAIEIAKMVIWINGAILSAIAVCVAGAVLLPKKSSFTND